MNTGISRVFAAVLIIAVVIAPCHAKSEQEHQTRSQTAAIAVGASIALLRPDVVFVKSMVNSNLLKGGFGEAHLNRHLISVLRRDGQWHPVTARLGSQGLARIIHHTPVHVMDISFIRRELFALQDSP